MNIIDTFLISEPFEVPLLLAKLHTGTDIAEFIAVESKFTFRGESKPLWLRKLVESDERFKPFRDRLTILEVHDNYFSGVHSEASYFKVEKKLRETSFPYITSKYKDGWVILSDVDELVDFSCHRRTARIYSILQDRTSSVQLRKLKYWYDFDNVSRQSCYLPFVKIPNLKVEDRYHRLSSVEGVLCFEYSSCFSKRDIWRKLNTFAHNRYVKEELDIALHTNTWYKSKARGEYIGCTPYDYFETIQLDETNSPQYIRDHLSVLKTYNVNPNYKLAREENVS